MAPEQAMGADADHRSDLYALGIMIYQMLLGQTPFRADTPAATLMAHVHRPLPLPRSLDPSIEPKLEATLLKALAKDPNDRFQSAKAMIRSLKGESGSTTPVKFDENLEATAVLDTEQLDDMESVEAPTAVLGEGVAPPKTPVPEADAPAIEPEAPAPPVEAAPSKFPWPIVAGGVGVAVMVGVVAILALSGGGSSGGNPTPSLNRPPRRPRPRSRSQSQSRNPRRA